MNLPKRVSARSFRRDSLEAFAPTHLGLLVPPWTVALVICPASKRMHAPRRHEKCETKQPSANLFHCQSRTPWPSLSHFPKSVCRSKLAAPKFIGLPLKGPISRGFGALECWDISMSIICSRSLVWFRQASWHPLGPLGNDTCKFWEKQALLKVEVRRKLCFFQVSDFKNIEQVRLLSSSHVYTTPQKLFLDTTSSNFQHVLDEFMAFAFQQPRCWDGTPTPKFLSGRWTMTLICRVMCT